MQSRIICSLEIQNGYKWLDCNRSYHKLHVFFYYRCKILEPGTYNKWDNNVNCKHPLAFVLPPPKLGGWALATYSGRFLRIVCGRFHHLVPNDSAVVGN